MTSTRWAGRRIAFPFGGSPPPACLFFMFGFLGLGCGLEKAIWAQLGGILNILEYLIFWNILEYIEYSEILKILTIEFSGIFRIFNMPEYSTQFKWNILEYINTGIFQNIEYLSRTLPDLAICMYKHFIQH